MSLSESSVGPRLVEVFARCQGRIIVTCFASNIHRVQQVVDAAATVGRRVSLIGRSMRKNTNIGRMLGHIDIPDGLLVGPKEIEDFPDHKLVIISTGSQGEPLSALRRMAHGDHPNVDLHDGDTVIFSATAIPGNERAVNETIDRIYRLGASVITAADVPVHASGHGYAEELKLMLNLTKPHYVMPVHGDHKRLRLHAELAEAVGIPPKSIFRGENGLPLEIDSSGARWVEREQAGLIFVDGMEVGDIEDVALRDRRMLSADGIFIVVATISEQDGRSVVPPEIIFRGVPFADEAAGFVDELRRGGRQVAGALGRGADHGDRPAPGPPARRHRRVRLRTPQAAPDGPARRRRGLARRRGQALEGQVPVEAARARVGAAYIAIWPVNALPLGADAKTAVRSTDRGPAAGSSTKPTFERRIDGIEIRVLSPALAGGGVVLGGVDPEPGERVAASRGLAVPEQRQGSVRGERDRVPGRRPPRPSSAE